MKKILNIVKNMLVFLVVALAVCMMIFTIVSVNTFDRIDRSIFGYKAFIVLSDSMSKTDFNAGDLVLVKETDPALLKEGDIISYQSTNTENYGEVVTHKIRKLTTIPMMKAWSHTALYSVNIREDCRALENFFNF